VSTIHVPAVTWPARLRSLFARPAPTVVYPALEPIPADWQAIEPRWDCQRCRSVQAAEILPDGFRCLACQVVTVTADA
jgi:hypothetical protein